MTTAQKRKAREALVALRPGTYADLKREGALSIKNTVGCSEQRAAKLLNVLYTEGIIELEATTSDEDGKGHNKTSDSHFRWARGATHI
jgi:hypothetical protein